MVEHNFLIILSSIIIERPVPIPKKFDPATSDSNEPPCKNFSALSDLLAMSIRNGGGNSNTTQLTIYLPSYDSMNLHVAETSNFNEVLLAILEAHQSEKLHPPLYYHAPEYYVIRMHEGKKKTCIYGFKRIFATFLL